MSVIPAEVKKKENIAEYIIHMYQTEDLIIAYDFNLDDIFTYVIRHMSKDEQVLKQLLLWYAGIIEAMQAEGVKNSQQRLRATQRYVAELSRLHEALLAGDTKYATLYDKAGKDIQHHIHLSGNTVTNPVQVCLNGLYGMLLLKLNGKKITAGQQAVLEKFGAVLAYLSEVYKNRPAAGTSA